MGRKLQLEGLRQWQLLALSGHGFLPTRLGHVGAGPPSSLDIKALQMAVRSQRFPLKVSWIFVGEMEIVDPHSLLYLVTCSCGALPTLSAGRNKIPRAFLLLPV